MELRLLDFIAVLGALALYGFSVYQRYARSQATYAALPQKTFPFAAYGVPGALFPTSWWNPALLYPWFFRTALYKDNPHRTVAVLSVFGGRPAVFSASMEVMKQAAAAKSGFDRDIGFGLVENVPLHAYNVATAQLDKYPRHRRIVQPAFNQQLYQQVWEESIGGFRMMTEGEGWSNKETVSLENLQNLNSKFTLSIISQVGFGISLPWNDEKKDEEMSLREAFHVTATTATVRSAIPQWAYKLPIKGVQDIKKALDKLLTTVKSEVEARRSGEKAADSTSGHDIFSVLLKANESETAGNRLDEEELWSNVFVLLFAGHETSSKALTVTLGLLAAHPEEQERVYQYILTVIGKEASPAFEDYDSLKPVFDCIMEALRLFPIAPIIRREASEDTTLTVPGLAEPVFVPKGTDFIGDIVGWNYDPTEFPDPELYNPERWARKSELRAEDYVSFGLGLHVCLGRRFALYEMVCFLTLFLRTWKVDPQLADGQTPREWRKQILEERVALGITFGPTDVPVTLIRR